MLQDLRAGALDSKCSLGLLKLHRLVRIRSVVQLDRLMTARRPEQSSKPRPATAGADPLLPLRFEKSCRPTFSLRGAETDGGVGYFGVPLEALGVIWALRMVLSLNFAVSAKAFLLRRVCPIPRC